MDEGSLAIEKSRAFAFIAMSGEKAHGTVRGVTWVDTAAGSARYLLLDDVQPAKLRVDLGRMVDADKREHYFILHKEELSVHVFKYGRATLAAELASEQVVSEIVG